MSFLVLGGLARAAVTVAGGRDHRDQLSRLCHADEPAGRTHRAGRAMSGPGSRVVAVDGPAASGKTTLARRLAVHFDLDFLDTGLLYRAVAWATPASGQAVHGYRERRRRGGRSDGGRPGSGHAAQRGRQPRRIGRGGDPGGAPGAPRLPAPASATAAPGAVLAGRDIGTVVRPDASHKIFVTASVEERAGAGARSCRPWASRLYMTTF